MPEFALPAMAEAAAGLFWLLLAVVIVGIIEFLRHAIPNPGLFGFHPLGFVQTMLQGIERWFIQQMDNAANYIVQSITNFVFVTKLLFNDIESVLGYHAGVQDHIAGDLVPAAENRAYGHADYYIHQEAVRARGAEAAAHAVGDSAWNFANGIARSIGDVVHGTVEGDITAAKNDAESTAITYANKWGDQLTNAMTAQLAGVWSALRPLQTAVSSTIPTEINDAANATAAAAAAALSTQVGLLNGRAQTLSDQIESAQADLQRAIAAEAQARAVAAAQDLSTAEGFATATAASAAGAVAAQDAAALREQVGVLQGELGTISTRVGTLEDTQSLTLPALPDVTLPNSITIPVAVGALGAAVADIVREFDSCAVTNCGSGPNNIGNVIKSLFGVGTEVAEFAFIAEAIKNPRGTANAVSPLLAAVDDSASSLLTAILSL